MCGSAVIANRNPFPHPSLPLSQVIAYGKLAGSLSSNALQLKYRDQINMGLGGASVLGLGGECPLIVMISRPLAAFLCTVDLLQHRALHMSRGPSFPYILNNLILHNSILQQRSV